MMDLERLGDYRILFVHSTRRIFALYGHIIWWVRWLINYFFYRRDPSVWWIVIVFVKTSLYSIFWLEKKRKTKFFNVSALNRNSRYLLVGGFSHFLIATLLEGVLHVLVFNSGIILENPGIFLYWLFWSKNLIFLGRIEDYSVFVDTGIIVERWRTIGQRVIRFFLLK